MKGSVVVAAEKGDLEELKKLIEEENYCVDSRGGKEKYVHKLFFKLLCKYIFNNFRTALINAVELGHVDVVKYLVEDAKADLDLSDDQFNTALIKAALNSSLEIVKILVENGASVDLQDMFGL